MTNTVHRTAKCVWIRCQNSPADFSVICFLTWRNSEQLIGSTSRRWWSLRRHEQPWMSGGRWEEKEWVKPASLAKCFSQLVTFGKIRLKLNHVTWGKIISQIRFSDGPTWTSTCQGQAPSAASAPPTILFSCNGGRPHSLPETMIPTVHVHTFLLEETASRNDLIVSIKYQLTDVNLQMKNKQTWRK